jgi:serine/threonine-protein kinase
MAFLGKFGIGGALDKLLSSGDIESTTMGPSLDKLLDNRKEATERVLERLDSGPKFQYSTSLQLLELLLDNTVIELIMSTIPDLKPGTQKDIATLLNTNKGFDPHLLLPFLKAPLSLEVCRDMLMAHRREFTAAKLLKVAAKTRPDLWDIIFELVHGRITDQAFPEAIALTKSKDTVLRKHATNVIADYNNPAAIEALQLMLKDDDREVQLSALRGLTRMKASLPAAMIFQLMKQMKKEEAPLIKALLSYSRDPQLMKYLNQILFGKNTKLRPFALQSLALIATEHTVREVFTVLADKPEEIHVSIIQALTENCGKRFTRAVAILANDPDEKIRNLAIKSISAGDIEDPEIIDLIKTHIDDDLPKNIKTSFIKKLGDIKDSESVKALTKIMRHDPEQRVIVLQTLEEIADEGPLADVFEMLAEDDADIQCAALSCLAKIIPEKFAGQIREQLIANADKLDEKALPNLINLLESIADKHRLPETTSYKKSLEKLQKEASGEVELVTLSSFGATTPQAAQADGNPFGVASEVSSSDAPDYPFGGMGSDVFGTGEVVMPEAKDEKPEEDFAIDLVVGQVLANRYELIKEIGRGGYGSVWLVEDKFIKEQLVMKFLHQTLVSDEIAIERFVRELRLARKITHANIIRLFDYLDLGSIAAISMEYFAGDALSSIIHKGVLEPERAVKLAITISKALEVAHQAEVVHRDMKPANILVDDNNMVKIVDFGIAAASKHAESRLTRTGTLVGTPTYISPEQIQGKEVDGRTDLYSLGVIMYEMMTGHPPYEAEDPMALVFMHVEGNARRLDEVNPVIPKEVADIVHKCIMPEPDERYQSMAELAQALSQLNFS